MSGELKPCPFCGGKAEVDAYGLTGRVIVIKCLSCGARTRAFDTDIKRGENAIEAWNRRSDGGRRETETEEKEKEAFGEHPAGEGASAAVLSLHAEI